MFIKALITTLALSATALGLGQAIVINRCDFPVYITSVDHEPHDTLTLASGRVWVEPQRVDPVTGISIKVTTTSTGLWNASPVLQLAYTAAPDPWIYYDLSTVYGFDPKFVGKTITLGANAPDAPDRIVWHGSPEPFQNTKGYRGYTDLTLTLCH